MRKRIVTARVGTVTTALTFLLLVVACERRSDTPNGGSVGSTMGTDSATVSAAPDLMEQRGEAMAPRAMVDAAPPMEVGVASLARVGRPAVITGVLVTCVVCGMAWVLIALFI